MPEGPGEGCPAALQSLQDELLLSRISLLATEDVTSSSRSSHSCSKECQVQDWPQHKGPCRTLQARAQHIEEHSLKGPETTNMLRDLDTYRATYFLNYLVGVAFRSAFRLGRNPDLLNTHFLRSGFLYDPEPTDVNKRFRFMDAGVVSFEEAIARSNDPRARAELEQGFETAKNRDLKAHPEYQKGYTFGACQFTARHVRTGKACYIFTSNFAVETGNDPVPFADVPINNNWLATLKQALSDPPRTSQQLIILDWEASMGKVRAHAIVRELAAKQQQEWADNSDAPRPARTPQQLYRDRRLY